jgi:catechol 2,3-dioxygenase-like lactoylglutathione lyase family enzyme
VRLTSVRLLVDDFEACHDFYARILGFTPRFGGGDGPYEEFDAHGGVVALFTRPLMAEAVDTVPRKVSAGACGDAAVLTLEVDDVDATALRLAGQGVTFVSEPRDQPLWRLRVAHFRDPCGNLIEINAPLRP